MPISINVRRLLGETTTTAGVGSMGAMPPLGIPINSAPKERRIRKRRGAIPEPAPKAIP